MTAVMIIAEFLVRSWEKSQSRQHDHVYTSLSYIASEFELNLSLYSRKQTVERREAIGHPRIQYPSKIDSKYDLI